MNAATISLLLLHLPLWICGDAPRSALPVVRAANEAPGASGPPAPARFIVSPALLALRGGAAREGQTRRQPSSLGFEGRVKTPNSVSARVKFSARPAKRAGDSAGRSDESSSARFARLGAPDGKHTPGISSSKRKSRLDLSSGDDDSGRVDSGRDRDGSSVRFARTPGKTPAISSRGKRASAPSPSDDSARERDESSVRFARLGAPDGKHTPASRRCAFASLEHGPLWPVPCLLLT